MCHHSLGFYCHLVFRSPKLVSTIVIFITSVYLDLSMCLSVICSSFLMHPTSSFEVSFFFQTYIKSSVSATLWMVKLSLCSVIAFSLLRLLTVSLTGFRSLGWQFFPVPGRCSVFLASTPAGKSLPSAWLLPFVGDTSLSLWSLLTSLVLIFYSFPKICPDIDFIIFIELGDHCDFWIWEFTSFIGSQNFQLLSLWILPLPHCMWSLLSLSSKPFSLTFKKHVLSLLWSG